MSSCEKDLYEEKKPEKIGIVTHEQFQNLMLQPEFLKAINKVPKKIKTTSKNSFEEGKTVMEHNYGFTISQGLVNKIQRDSLTTFTMHIVSDVPVADEIQNLIVQINNQNKIESWIIKYKVNVETLAVNEELAIKNGTFELTPIIYNDTPVINGLMDACQPVISWRCDATDHGQPGVACTQGYWEVSFSCGSGGYSTSAPDYSNLPIYTDPIGHSGAGVDVAPDPCLHDW